MGVFAQVGTEPVHPIALFVICEGPMLGKRVFSSLPAMQQVVEQVIVG